AVVLWTLASSFEKEQLKLAEREPFLPRLARGGGRRHQADRRGMRYTRRMDPTPSLSELKRALEEYVSTRDSLADAGRYYLFDLDIAARHTELERLIRQTRATLARLYPRWDRPARTEG